MPRAEREAFVDHDGGQLGVEHRGAEGVLEAADEDRLVDERIQRPAKAAPLCGQAWPACGGRAGDDQDLEIGPMGFRAREGRMQRLRRSTFAIIVRIPVAGILAKRAGKQGARDAPAQGCSRVRVIGRSMLAQRRHQLVTGIGMKLLGRRHLGERRFERCPIARAVGPGVGQLHQVAPLIGSRSRTRKEPVDAHGVTACIPRHLKLFLLETEAG